MFPKYFIFILPLDFYFRKAIIMNISINGHKECTLFLHLPKSINDKLIMNIFINNDKMKDVK